MSELAEMKAQKDAAYLERNQVVAALAMMVLRAGGVAGVARTAIEGWSEDWHSCVYIDLPTGQASWHYHDTHAHLFESLPPYCAKWDGHTTEEKYQRLARIARIGRTCEEETVSELTRTELRRIADEFQSERDAAKRDAMRAFEERDIALAENKQLRARYAEVLDQLNGMLALSDRRIVEGRLGFVDGLT